jgi:glucose uptake protein GlcU
VPRASAEQIAEGVDWLIGVPAVSLGMLWIIADRFRPSPEALGVMFAAALVALGVLLVTAPRIWARCLVAFYLSGSVEDAQ